MSLNIALAIVIRNRRVLIQKRMRPKLGMVYEFPGGKVDMGETIEQGAKRELFEETGLQACKDIDIYSYQKDQNTLISFVVLSLDHTTQEPYETNPLRQQSFYWLSLSEIPIKSFQTLDQDFINTELENYIDK